MDGWQKLHLSLPLYCRRDVLIHKHIAQAKKKEIIFNAEK